MATYQIMALTAKRMPVLIAMCSMVLIVPDWLAAQAPTQQCVVVDPQCNFSLPEGCSCQKSTDITGPPPLPAPPGCDPEEVKKQLSTLTGTIKFLTAAPNCKMTQEQCEALPGRHVDRLSDGTLVCAPNKCSKTCYKFGGTVEVCSTCLSLPIDPKRSVDPNDKAGPLGAATAQFIAADMPLSYTIHFENLPTATAPAQVVVVTDRLDPVLMDLDTFRLGPISFGNNTLLPVPGVKGWTGGVDFRPDQNLIVTINAGLDKVTGLVSWYFTSIDPDTGQLTEDPDAGFLPPNTTPPAGEGSVVFTVMPKGQLPTGTQITNQARVVFDVNAPINTPQWLNTIDNSKPTSAVSPLASTQSSTSFPIQWSGTDTGSGISDFTILVSDNGGPFNPFVSNTTNTSATFTGQNGHTYAFYSIATDLAGNIENSKTVADTVTTVTLSQPPTAGDINGDGKVDCADLAIIKASFGKRCGQIGFDSRADTNKDCVVDVRDLAFVSQKLPVGTRCP